MRRTAERLLVSQPAVSKVLQRLRDHFEDELFVKTHHGLRATEYANDLAENSRCYWMKSHHAQWF